MQFFMENLKMKRKKDNIFLTFRSGDLNPRFSVIFPPMIFSCEVRSLRLNQNKLLKEIGLYLVPLPPQNSEFQKKIELNKIKYYFCIYFCRDQIIFQVFDNDGIISSILVANSSLQKMIIYKNYITKKLSKSRKKNTSQVAQAIS